MKKSKRILLTLIILLLVGGVFGIFAYGPYFNFYLIPPSVEKYADIALTYMNNGLFADTEDFKEVQKKVREEAKEKNTYEGTYELLEEALYAAGGMHSFLIRPEETAEQDGEEIHGEMPTVSLDGDFLYLKLPPIMLASQEESQKYVDTLLAPIVRENYKGIILDLRDNTGGDMNPMITGVSPLLPDGKLMDFKYSTGDTHPVILKEGNIEKGGQELEGDASKVKTVPIAILINESTASSGEITALSFMGLANVKFFGTNSAGYTSVNSSFHLYDGAILALTTASVIDRTGKEYMNEQIIPDVVTNTPLEDAKAWIEEEI